MKKTLKKIAFIALGCVILCSCGRVNQLEGQVQELQSKVDILNTEVNAQKVLLKEFTKYFRSVEVYKKDVATLDDKVEKVQRQINEINADLDRFD